MKPTYLAINLLQEFNPADEDFAALKRDADNWEKSIPLDEAGKKAHPMQSKLVTYSQNWFVRVLTGFVFIFAKRWIVDYLNPVNRTGEARRYDEDEEQSDEDVQAEFEEYLEFKKRGRR